MPASVKAALTVTAAADGTVWYGQFEGGSWQGVEEAMKNLRTGEKVQANQPLLTLVSGLCVKTAVAEDRLTDLPPGTEARITPVAFQDLVMTGKSSTPTLVGMRKGDAFDTRFDFAEGDSRLVPGLKAKILVRVAVLKDGRRIPVSRSGYQRLKELM